MCGICGAAGPSASTIPVRKMCDLIRHRGPDDEGYLKDDRVVLGHVRLSIIDVSGGKQPMCNEDGSVCIVFNGEIYNFVELREILSISHNFMTKSDTETILHAYEEWGLGFIHRLRGMYAFALYDSKKGILLLARDRLGKKPLYYTLLDDGTLVFASEVTCFKAIYGGVFPRQALNTAGVAYYLYYGYVPQPMTIISDIHSLIPSTMLVYDVRSGIIATVHYWEPLPGEGKTPRDPVNETYRILREAVRIRLRSDVPLSILMSGGLDSTIVASLAAKEWLKDYEQGVLRYKLRAITVGFPGTPYDETELARRAAEYIGVDHVVIDMDIDKALSMIDTLAKRFDQPFGDTSMLPTHLAFRAARLHSKVALTGDGGDEVFLGYPWMLVPCESLLKDNMHRMQTWIANLLSTYRRLLSTSSKLMKGLISYYNTYLLLDKRNVKRMIGKAPSPFKPIDVFISRKLPSCVDRLDYATIRFYLVNDILVKVDRASMLTSLEARSPLLDQVLVEKVTSMPIDVRYAGVRKKLLREIAIKHRLIPRMLLTQPKRGFGAPVEYWLNVIDFESAGLKLERMGLRGALDIIKKFRRGRKPYHARVLFSLYTLAEWLEKHVE